MADQRTTINAWLIEHGYLTSLEELADGEPLASVAEAVREIIESEAPELATADAPWLEVATGFAATGEVSPKEAPDAKERAMPTMKTSSQLDRDLLRDAHTDLEAVRDMLREGDTELARKGVGSLLGRIEARQSDWRNQRLGDWEYRYDMEAAAVLFESADGYRGRYQFDDEWLWFQCPGDNEPLQRGCREMREPVEVLNRAEELRQEHLQEEAAHRRLSGE